MDWANPVPPSEEAQGARPVPHIISEMVEESKEYMSSLTTGFSAQMRKRAAIAQGETNPNSKVPGGKRPKTVWSR